MGSVTAEHCDETVQYQIISDPLNRRRASNTSGEQNLRKQSEKHVCVCVVVHVASSAFCQKRVPLKRMKYLNWEERFTSTENTKKRLFKHRRASEWITDFMCAYPPSVAMAASPDLVTSFLESDIQT
ncbi:hypothetical protein T4B_13449 [Trichinella pseudospiralis]|uniref:Uncharacterized protein n=1 Tax=Trichinella pseudospiralis TaxID=6337 RepID=A0A0V1IJH6_TRIPS|nr:hypothetical protein T4B_13449 [Trichinella pseudospiralis]KRZ22676.1 hypothetical protein T4C_8064 [Trichinella pseudospiralis]KRZ22986.1 hypothetical protein T4C_9154 [Trichinella pseudospiralis]KRZ22987.1 hypothetical protein T4C_3572 [Trichinella pseudospiralis]